MTRKYGVEIIENNSIEVYSVSFDVDQIKMLRDSIVDELSLIEEHNCTPCYFNYFDDSECNGYEIRSQSISYSSDTDIWPVVEVHYNRAVFPYIVRLLDRIIDNNDINDLKDALREIIKPIFAREYIPIQELVMENMKAISEERIIDELNNDDDYCYPYRSESIKNNIRKYTNLILDDDYMNKLVEYYDIARLLININRVYDESYSIPTRIR